jgi:hypothetical protein
MYRGLFNVVELSPPVQPDQYLAADLAIPEVLRGQVLGKRDVSAFFRDNDVATFRRA